MKLKLYNAEIDITEERNAYSAVRRHFEDLPNAAVDQFVQAYRECKDCHQFAEIGYAKGRQIIAAAAQVGVDFLVERGCYDLTHEVFFNEYLAPYLNWHSAYSEWDDAYGNIIAEGAEMEAYRERRMQNRSRFVGGGFGIGGAVKGIAMAGAANAAWGAVHGLRNAIASASARAAQKKQLSAFFNDEQNRNFLANAIYFNAKAVHAAVFEFIVKSAEGQMPGFLADLDLVERAVRLKTNLTDGKIPLNAAPDVVPDILEGNPYDEDRYLLALAYLGDPDGELQHYGLLHDIDVLEMKLVHIRSEIAPLLRAPTCSATEAAEKLRGLATNFACLYDDEVIALQDEIDRKGRTFENHVYPTVADMEQAARERDSLAAAFASIGSDLGEERARLADLKAQSHVYHGAEAALKAHQDKLDAIDLKQRSFDGHVYASADEAQQARADKKAIHAIYVVGSQIGQDLDKEREKLALLRAGVYVYSKAGEILDAYQAKIDSEDLKQKTVDGQVYASRAEAQQAAADKKTIDAVFTVGSQINQDLEKEREKLAKLRSGVFTYRQANEILDAYEEKIRSEELRQKTFGGQVYASREEATEARKQKALADRDQRASSSTSAHAASLKPLSAGLVLGMLFIPFVALLVILRNAYSSGARAFALIVLAMQAYSGYQLYLKDQGAQPKGAELAQSGQPQPAVQPVAYTPAAPAAPAVAPPVSAPESSPPFVGKRIFNFMGGNGTQNAIVIDENRQARVESLGTTGSSVDYEGPFVNPLPLPDGRQLLFKGSEVYLLKGTEVETGCAEDGKPCVSQLFAD